MPLNPPPSRTRLVDEAKSDTIWKNWFYQIYRFFGGERWEDLLAEITLARPPGAGTPASLANFGPTSISQQPVFNRGDAATLRFHITHNIKPGSKMYPHVHWSTDGTAATSGVSDIVEWEIDYQVAKGHQQEEFTDQTQIVMTQSVYNDNSGGPTNPDAWHHYITEASDAQAITAPEVDSLIIMRVRRGSTSDTYDNTGSGHVFGLYVDFHYIKDRFGTPFKSPDFYKR
jgi:hypothetical protein